MSIDAINAVQAPIAQQVEEVKKETVNQQPKVDLKDPVDTVELSSKVDKLEQKALKGKKVKNGIASACIPGLGQFLNGDKMKGFQIYAGHLGIAAYTLAAAACGVLPAAAIGLAILAAYDTANIVDAVKTTK